MFEHACLFDTDIGLCGISWSEAGLTSVQTPAETPEAAATRICRHGAELVEEADVSGDSARAIDLLRAFTSGVPTGFDDIRLDMHRHGDFEQAIYRLLREVPWGETVTYGSLAKAAGQPQAAQAVGMAMGRNSWPLIVPCHRVLAAGGKPGGFTAYRGVALKAELLEQEGVYLDGGQLALFE